jgi:excinuclease ABC subunit A
MKPRKNIEVIGAKQNNLKNISVNIPRDKLTVITGVSGSGKSSLAFDVIYGEAQRRFLDSISNFAKARIAQIKKPKVDFVNGLSPVVAIEQKKGNNNPRSTIGTVTDINDYLRLLFATAGVGACPVCGYELRQFSPAQMAERIANLPKDSVVTLLAPVKKIFEEDYNFLFKKIREKGFRNLLVNGKPHTLSDTDGIDLGQDGEDDGETDIDREAVIEIVVDTFTVKPDIYIQVAKSIEAALMTLDDMLLKIKINDHERHERHERFYKDFACPEHHFALCEMQAFHFSFNIPASACSTCAGLGSAHIAEPRFLIVAPGKSVMKGAIHRNVFNPTNKDSNEVARIYSLFKHYGFNLETPYQDLPERAKQLLLYGTKPESFLIEQPPFAKKKSWIVGRTRSHGGYVNNVNRWYRDYMKRAVGSEVMEPDFIKDVMIERVCPECNGARLKASRLAVTINGYNIDTLSRMQIPDLQTALRELTFSPHKADVGKSITAELDKRLQLLIDVGLYYLSISRRSDSVSGGEMQRIKMSTQISSELMGMLYVMDEPSIGLHSRDSKRVIDIMKRLRDIGNTVIVVEHDMETMRNADYLIEIGPGPGNHGGRVTADGSYEKFLKNKASLTADYLSGRKAIELPPKRRNATDASITVGGARANNLKDITVDIPLNLFVCITGVSGSGKSTLIHEVLFKHMEILKKQARIQAGEADYVLFGESQVNNVINIDQSPIGRGSKSNPATYVGIYDRIRKLYAETDEAVARGYTALDFSLTHANGCRCEHCTGDGVIVTALQYMADIEVPCPVCKGMRFNEEGTEIKINGKSIADVLDMTVEEALHNFRDENYLKHKLTIMNDLGLGYLKLGQRSTTLSGGESQRIKLSYELAKIKRGSHNLYILDEPTTGLHMVDIQRLLDSINRIVDGGHTVIVIEHNIDVIKSADYIIDMGPEGGRDGGRVVAQGPPEAVAECEGSYTGLYLKNIL